MSVYNDYEQKGLLPHFNSLKNYHENNKPRTTPKSKRASYRLINRQNRSEEDYKKYDDLLHNISAYEAKNTCPACYGAGVIPGELVGCYHCSGTGILIEGR